MWGRRRRRQSLHLRRTLTASESCYLEHHYIGVSMPVIRTVTGVPSKLSHLGGVPRPHNARAIKNTRLPVSSAVDCEGSPPSHKSEESRAPPLTHRLRSNHTRKESSSGEPLSPWIDPSSNEHLSTIETNLRDPDD
ncbi:BnaA02g36560D [Brassica napus]|uniref:(rape) hypothetical protein n=1 Tax=Brassica napus TaxID=3708 RepID=A0A078IYA0_BRANA|nr:unnamed protein product [Brassica napus]CDY55371.1 BnaA02g36560D [Brassica napus]